MLILADMLLRMGFSADAARMRRVWRTLYSPRHIARMPPQLLSSATTLLPQVVDEIAFQTRRNLAHRALVDVIGFTQDNEAAIRETARHLAEGSQSNPDLPPRHLVGAAAYALETGRIRPDVLSARVVSRLAARHPPAPATIAAARAAVAA